MEQMSAIGDFISSLGGSSEEETTSTSSSSTAASELNPYLLDVFGSEVESAQDIGEEGLSSTEETEGLYQQNISDLSSLTNTFQQTFEANLKEALEALTPQLALTGLEDSALGTRVKTDTIQELMNTYLEQAGQFELDTETAITSALSGLSTLQELPVEYATAIINAILGQSSQGTAAVSTETTGTGETDTDTQASILDIFSSLAESASDIGSMGGEESNG